MFWWVRAPFGQLRLDRCTLPGAAIDAATLFLGQDLRPGLPDDVDKLQRRLPMPRRIAGQLTIGQRVVQRFGRDAFVMELVDQQRQLIRQIGSHGARGQTVATCQVDPQKLFH